MDMKKYNEWPANHKGDKNPSPKIIALGKRITDVAGHMIGGVTVEDPEYWGLAEIITEDGRGGSYHEKTCALHI